MFLAGVNIWLRAAFDSSEWQLSNWKHFRQF